MAVPSKFRTGLGERMFITRGFDKCLSLYPAAEYERIAASVNSLSKLDPKARDLGRLFFSEAAEVELDKQGRINIPARLRDFAGVSGDDSLVRVVGVNTHVEIWSAIAWDQRNDELDKDPSAIAASFADLGIF